MLFIGCVTPLPNEDIAVAQDHMQAAQAKSGEIAEATEKVEQVAVEVKREADTIDTAVGKALDALLANDTDAAAVELGLIEESNVRLRLRGEELEKYVHTLRSANNNLHNALTDVQSRLEKAQQDTARLQRQAKRFRVWRIVAIVVSSAFVLSIAGAIIAARM